MSNAEILVAETSGDYKIKVVGRATFSVGPTLRELVKNLEMEADKRSVTIDLTDCTGMDSTFMGILAMMALQLRKDNITIKIVNAGENQKLLNGLGLSKLFNYVEEEVNEAPAWHKKKTDSNNKESAATVLEAHKTLMEADDSNVDKFKSVVELVEKEIEKE